MAVPQDMQQWLEERYGRSQPDPFAPALPSPGRRVPPGQAPEPAPEIVDPFAAGAQPPPQARPEPAPAEAPPEPLSDEERAYRDAQARLRRAENPTTGQQFFNLLQGWMEGRDYQGPAWEGQRRQGQQDVELARQRLRESKLRDPGSEESRRAQSRIAPLVEAAGIDPAILQQTSAAEIGETADVATLMANMRSKQQQAEAQRQHQAQMELQKRQMKLQDRDEERQYKEQLRRQQRLDELEDYIARRQAGYPFDLAISAARGSQAAQVAGERAESVAEAKARAPLSAEKVAKGAQDFGTALEKSSIVEQTTTLKALKQAIEEAKEAHGGEIFPGAAEIVRRGPRAWRGLADPASRKVLQLMDRVQNIELKDRSGAAVTAPEFERYKAEVGSGLFDTEAELERAINTMHDTVMAHRDNVFGQFTPEMVDLYYQNQRRNLEAEQRRRQGGGGEQGGDAIRWQASDGTRGIARSPETFQALQERAAEAGVEVRQVE